MNRYIHPITGQATERRRENRWNNPVIREKEASLFEDLPASGAEPDEFVDAR